MSVSTRREVDCLEMELPMSTPKVLVFPSTAASEEKRKKMEGVFVIRWLMKHLEFSKVDLD
jgi:hypothetical protein